MRRISVVGVTGSGKTTLARALGSPYLELDSIFHQPGWQPLDTEAFRARVGEFITADSWVVDGNYSAVRDLVWARADTVVWLDLPRRRVMRQLTRRTLRRMVSGAELWNGNTEDWRNLFRLRANSEQSILVFAWNHHGRYRARYQAAEHDIANQHLTFIRLPSRAAAARLVAGLAGQPAVLESEVGGVAGE